LSSRAALFWRARDLGAPCECLAFFARREIARLARIPMGKLHQARASIAERRSPPALRSVGMSCAETLAGEAIGGYRLKTPASQIASYSSQETELAALVSRKSFCILLWPLRGDQVSSGRDGTSRLPAICCLLSNKWPVGALILLFHHCRRAFARPGRVRDPSLRGHCRFHPMLESACEAPRANLRC